MLELDPWIVSLILLSLSYYFWEQYKDIFEHLASVEE